MCPKNYFSPLLLIIAASCLFFASCRTFQKTPISKTNATNTNKENSSGPLTKEAGKTTYTDRADIPEIKANEPGKTLLYSFIREWEGVPYKYGGRSKSGVDCSNFVSLLYNKVYEKPISGSSAGLVNLCSPVQKEALKEGDLVFFKIRQDKVSHVGVYLGNNKFVHATTQKGVMINDLDEAYYKKYYYKAGRLK